MSSEVEMGYCDTCHKYNQVQRKYYHYPIDCECCGGTTHFEIVKHCKDCIPHPPEWIRAQVKPIQKNSKIHPEHWDYYA